MFYEMFNLRIVSLKSYFQALGAYSVSKTALFGLTKAMANELASSGIRVNCIAPGLIKTKFSSIVSSMFVV